jgi:osmotically-inducible protein OsmY
MSANVKMILMVAAVLTNLLVVGCGTTDPGITTAVKSKLAADERTSAMKIDVDTNQKVVTLNGRVRRRRRRLRPSKLRRH